MQVKTPHAITRNIYAEYLRRFHALHVGESGRGYYRRRVVEFGGACGVQPCAERRYRIRQAFVGELGPATMTGHFLFRG